MLLDYKGKTDRHTHTHTDSQSLAHIKVLASEASYLPKSLDQSPAEMIPPSQFPSYATLTERGTGVGEAKLIGKPEIGS